jgi:hypothetical protein
MPHSHDFVRRFDVGKKRMLALSPRSFVQTAAFCKSGANIRVSASGWGIFLSSQPMRFYASRRAAMD